MFLEVVKKGIICTYSTVGWVFQKVRLADPTGCHQSPSSGTLQGLASCALLCPTVPSAGIQGRLSQTQRLPPPSLLSPFRESMFGDLLEVPAYLGQKHLSLSLIY